MQHIFREYSYILQWTLLSCYFFPFQSDSRSSLTSGRVGLLSNGANVFLSNSTSTPSLFAYLFLLVSWENSCLWGNLPISAGFLEFLYLLRNSLNGDPSMKFAWENYVDIKQWKDATAFSTSILPSSSCPSCYFWSSLTYFVHKNGNSQAGVWGLLNTQFSYQNILVLTWWVMLKPDVQPYRVLQSLKYSGLAFCFVLITPAELGTGPTWKGVMCQGFRD